MSFDHVTAEQASRDSTPLIGSTFAILEANI
jgi:hypothetical protein